MNYSIPEFIEIVEVGPRDGLQNEKHLLKTEEKLQYIELLIEAGIKRLEVTSFVKPDSIPQMQDAKTLFEKCSKLLLKYPDVELISLIPNLKGLDTALSVDAKSIAVFTAASNLFNEHNIKTNILGSFDRIQSVLKKANEKNLKVRGYISTVFGCPYEGNVSPDHVLDVVKFFKDNGVGEISFGDTIGVATPGDVNRMLDLLLKELLPEEIAMHFHDTRGFALANILASLNYGIFKFDASAGGLGGCPYAKGASGNVATEEVVSMIQGLKGETNIDLLKLMKANEYVMKILSKTSYSKMYSAFEKTRKLKF